jgi:hypothetical protein
MPNRKILFKVLTGVVDHGYVIYDNGEIEGFGEGAIVFNYYPALVEDAIYRSGAKGISSAPACETRMCTSFLVGASHGTPE